MITGYADRRGPIRGNRRGTYDGPYGGGRGGRKREFPADLDIEVIEGWIASCIDDAPAGAAATPWLLAEIARRSSGRSLAANKQLIIDNAALAGAIAACL